MFFEESNKTAMRHKRISLVSSLFFFMLLFLFVLPIRAESRTTSKDILDASEVVSSIQSTDTDTNKVKYELNDPRNPDCPCHNAQKQADEEYRKLQEQNGNNAEQNNVATNTNSKNQENPNIDPNKNNTGAMTGGTSKHYSNSKNYSKHIMHWMKKVKRHLGNKNNGTKKGKRRLADCFHFN